jgi:histidinol-phosphate aminotransferase
MEPSSAPITPAVDPLSFVREDLRAIDKYVGVKPLEVLADEIGIDLDEIVKLDANENLYGPPKEYMEAIAKSFLHIYPDPTQVLLRKDIANYVGVDDSQVVAGAGSDDMIDIILRFAVRCSRCAHRYLFVC